MVAHAPLTHGRSVRTLDTRAFRLIETCHHQGQVIARHQHEHACVNFVLEGCYREDLSGLAGAFEPLQAVYKPAGESHANRFEQAGARALLVELRDDALLDPELPRARATWTRDPSVARTGLALWRELSRVDACSVLVVDQLAVELHEGMGAERHRSRADSARVRAAAAVLHDAPREPWSLSTLACEVGLHPSHLARAFRSAHGCTVGEYLRRLRLNEVARRLARGNDSIAGLASAFGFADQSHCTRSFRRWFGTTPAAYRRAFRGS